jgi:hypothetical protein
MLSLEDGSRGRITASYWLVENDIDDTSNVPYLLRDIKYVIDACPDSVFANVYIPESIAMFGL